MTISELHKIFEQSACGRISTDTRAIEADSLFFAWKWGEQDGNAYAAEALVKGASYVVIDNSEYHKIEDSRYILVKDSIQTLQELAAYHRGQYGIPVVAVAGSNGKTTTKELIGAVLETELGVVASKGSHNNHVGVPKTLLKINSETEIAVIEMGTNHPGEIAPLCRIANPTHGLITNIGRDHIGFFGSEEAIADENLELYKYLSQYGGQIFIPENETLLQDDVYTKDALMYGAELTSLETQPYLSVQWKNNDIQTKFVGEYNRQNIAAAIAVGWFFGVNEKNIVKGIENYLPDNNRSELHIGDNGSMIVKDFYNANKNSMQLAIQSFEKIIIDDPQKKSLAVLGDMFELGEFALQDHQAIVDSAEQSSADEIILVGEDFGRCTLVRAKHYMNTVEAIASMQSMNFSNTKILMKASNGMNFQKIFDEFFK